MNTNKFIQDMLTNLNTVADYFNNPKAVLDKFEIGADEQRMFMANDIDSLATLGISREVAAAALSGAHSKTCPSLR